MTSPVLHRKHGGQTKATPRIGTRSYRVYFFQRSKELVILLCGGDKSTQDADIAFALRLKAEIERSDGTPPL
jgi:hypothetical protein